ANYSPGWKGFGGMKALTMPAFKQWLESGKTGEAIEGQTLHYAKEDPKLKELSLHDLVDRIRLLGPVRGKDFLEQLAELLKSNPQLRQQIALKDLAFIQTMAETHYERGSNPFLAPAQYAKSTGGHWVTIGSHDGHGGSPVYIDKNGKITKGHPGLTDRNVASLDQPYTPERHVDLKHKILKALHQGTGRISEETHDLESLHKKLDKHPREHVEEALSDLHESGHVNVHTPKFGLPRIYHTDKPFEETTERQRINQSKEYERAKWGKRARQEGMDAGSLHQLAAEFLAHDKEYKSDISKMLKDARKTAEHFDEKLGGAGFQQALAQGTFDSASIPHFDEIAATMAVQFPDVFQGHDPDERLADLLQAGNPEPMSQDDAYSEAFEALYEHREAAGGSEEDPVPFRRKGAAASYGRSLESSTTTVEEMTKFLSDIIDGRKTVDLTATEAEIVAHANRVWDAK
ncbi:MAG TPA: hypothetical protein VNX28_08710, partial [Gemmataceae bacterium]|nr:hypothetical protein [Gemmataceae bacterium]